MPQIGRCITHGRFATKNRSCETRLRGSLSNQKGKRKASDMASFTAASSQAEPSSHRSVRRQDPLVTKIGVQLSCGPRTGDGLNVTIRCWADVRASAQHHRTKPQRVTNCRDVVAIAYGTTHTNICKIFGVLPDRKNTSLSVLTWRTVAMTGAEASAMEARRRSRRDCRGRCRARPDRNLRAVAPPTMLVGNPHARTASGRVLTARIALLPEGARARAVEECLGEARMLLIRLHQVRRARTPRSAPRTTRTLRRLAATGQVR